MILRDLGKYLTMWREGTLDASGDEAIINPDVKFKVIVDDAHPRVKPPLENLDLLFRRELIVNGNEVYSENHLERKLLFTEIEAAMASEEGLFADKSPIEKQHPTNPIEYEHLGRLPDGSLFLENINRSAIHVGLGGKISQIDLMLLRKGVLDGEVSTVDEKQPNPINREFKKIITNEYMDHDWSDLSSKFLSKD
ncbi:hypothetical protein GF325_00375 [Candidatus Bathyarchaeota archaeon]|nr:hypothetical protein [Candidatus Bathyarchaeota archaeon]